MTEGLLHKKLRRDFEENFGLGDEGMGFEDVKEVLDEAAADFPKLPFELWDKYDQICNLSEETFEKLQLWFKKWFGVLSQGSSAEESCEEATKK